MILINETRSDTSNYELYIDHCLKGEKIIGLMKDELVGTITKNLMD